MDNLEFNLYAAYYDLIYRDKDYKSEVDYVQDIVNEFSQFKHNRSILEFGSGTGIHGSLLAERGFSVYGIELSRSMINLAKASSNFDLVQGDIRFHKVGKKFDSVLSLFHVFSYQLDNYSVEQVFNNASDHLDEGGLFIFDFWYSPAVYHLQPEVRVKRVVDECYSLTRIAEPELIPNENKVDVKYSIFVEDKDKKSFNYFEELHTMRHFSLPEINLLAEKFGFRIEDAREFLTSKTPSFNTWAIYVVCRKI